jgi:hypothetical protein
LGAKDHYNRIFALPAEQIRYYDELTTDQKGRCHYLFGKYNADSYVYAVRKDGGLVSNRERLRPEWEGQE